MAIQILDFTADPEGSTDTRVFFALVALASDDIYRQADFSELAGAVIGGEEIKSFIEQWIPDNQATVDAAIDVGTVAGSERENNAKTRDLRDEAKQFLIDNPQARAIIDLPGPDLESVIENRTAGQETLLLKTLAFAVRYLFESVRLLK